MEMVLLICVCRDAAGMLEGCWGAMLWLKMKRVLTCLKRLLILEGGRPEEDGKEEEEEEEKKQKRMKC